MRYLISFLFCLLIFSVLAQNTNNIDSLENSLQKAGETDKLDILLQLSKAHWNVIPHKGINYANQAYKLAEKHDNKKNQAKALLYGGVNYWSMGSYDQAIEYYHKSIKIAEEIDDKKISTFNLNNLGMIYHQMGNYEKALQNYSKASIIMKELGDEIEYAKIINNIGTLNMILGNYDQALKNFLSIIEKVKSSGNQKLLLWILKDIGKVYYKKQNYNQALDYYFKALKISNETGDNKGKTIILNNIGDIHLKKKEYKKALNYYNKGLIFAKKAEAKDRIKINYQNLSEYYSEVGNYKKSLEYYTLFKEMSDSILDENKVHKIVEMQTKYETEKKEKENELLRKDNEIQQLAIDRQIYLRNFFIALSFFVIILVIFIFTRFQIKKKANRILFEKNNLITQQKTEIQTNADALAEANATKDKFFSIIAHDLKNPFNAIWGYSELLLTNYEQFSEKERINFITEINDSSKSTYELLENLLTWARTQSSKININKEKLNLSEFVNNSIKPYKPNANNKNITISNEVSDDIIIEADEYTISTVIGNLINNAIKFTHNGGHITITSLSNANYVGLSIKDTGIGMSKETIDKLFRIDESCSDKGANGEKGTGLGLILCQEFIKMNDGEIKVESEVGKGSTFIFYLPKK